MWDNVVGGLIVATVTSLTYVAYKHPRGYRRLSTVLLVALFIASLAIGCFQVGVVVTGRALAEYYKPSEIAAVNAVIKGLQGPIWIAVALWASFAWLNFLRWLPELLDLNEEQ